MSEQQSLEKAKRWVFAATFVNYAMSHWTRKSYTNVKVQLMGVGVSAYTLAAMDSAFMFTYAGGSFITGPLGDRFSPTAVVGIGLLGSTVCLFLITVGASTSIASSITFSLAWFAGIQLFHGLFQATGGPVNTAIMGNWFPKKGRGLIFGLWTCHQYMGDIIAALASAMILQSTWLNWKYAIIIPMILNGIWSFINFKYVPNEPKDIGLQSEDSQAAAAAQDDGLKKKNKEKEVEVEVQAIGIIEAFNLPNVMGYAIAFGFFKLINYAMFFQLPVILSANFDSATANIISALYSVGMMPGGIICGFVSDLYGGRRACVCATMMILLIPLLLILAFYMDTIPIVTLLLLLCLMGCLVGGPNNIITSAVAADLADDPSIKGSSKALGTVTGIINGSGSVTAAFGQMAIPILYDKGLYDNVGYRYVWFFLVFCTIMGTALLGPKIYRELFIEHVSTSSNGSESKPLSEMKSDSNKSSYQALSTDPMVEMQHTRQLV